MKELIERWIGSGDIQIVEREVDPKFECAAVITRAQQAVSYTHLTLPTNREV